MVETLVSLSPVPQGPMNAQRVLLTVNEVAMPYMINIVTDNSPICQYCLICKLIWSSWQFWPVEEISEWDGNYVNSKFITTEIDFSSKHVENRLKRPSRRQPSNRRMAVIDTVCWYHIIECPILLFESSSAILKEPRSLVASWFQVSIMSRPSSDFPDVRPRRWTRI